MLLTELQAQQITLVRVLEQTRDNGGLWTAGDAHEATRAARELVGRGAPFHVFVARRAQWALEEIQRRSPGQAVRLRVPRLPFWAGWVLAVCALLAGFATDYLAAQPHIDVVEWPLVLLIGWNWLVFTWLCLAWLWRRIGPGHGSHGLPAAALGRWWVWEMLGLRSGKSRPWAADFRQAWATLAAPLQAVRFRLAAHLAALLFALGAVGSFWARGISEEYRAGWKTTYAFVNGELLHAIVSVVLAPGAWLLNLPIPDAQHIDRLRMPGSAGEVAEPWIWLYGASVLVWVAAPRLCLVLLNALARWRLRRAFPLPMRGAYFITLGALWGGQSIGVVVVPFRYALSPDVRRRLATMLERIYGLAVDIAIEPPVLMGNDATDWKKAIHPEGHVAVLALFPLAATAEADAQGVLLQRLQRSAGSDTPVVPVVDMGGFPLQDIDRLRQRCNQWRRVLDKVGCKPLFVDLQQTREEDLQALHQRLNHDH